MNLFIDRLKILLASSGKRQTDICAELGISKQKLTNWKSGYSEPNIDDIMMLAKYFEVTTDYLVGLENEDGTKVH
ncbi:MAG: helix-turn-helix transcriptional regulator [Clostridia bacterium]|jgi:transcriptional regulator with XRE-family HTH domain|nr:helix-turn-helix transcriptional regulator [Clostridia bacterium]